MGLKNHGSIEIALVKCSQKKNCMKVPLTCLTETQVQLLTTVTPILNAVSEATTILSAEKSVSISLVYPCITILKNYLCLMDKRGIGKFVDDLTTQLEMRFDLSEGIFLTATFLDPRFKSEMFTLAEIQIVKSYQILKLLHTSKRKRWDVQIVLFSTGKTNVTFSLYYPKLQLIFLLFKLQIVCLKELTLWEEE